MRACHVSLCWCALVVGLASPRAAAAGTEVALPLARTTYFVGERVPVAVVGRRVRLEGVHDDGAVLLHKGDAGLVLVDTSALVPGSYALRLDGAEAGAFRLVSPVRRSVAAITDEASPKVRDGLAEILRATGVNAIMAPDRNEIPRQGALLDHLARAQTLYFPNPYTRPTSFNPVGLDRAEQASFRQKVALIAQANARHPNFAGFYLYWDPVGLLNRKMLLVYWGWGDKTQALRKYIARTDRAIYDEFTRRTGLAPVTAAEFANYAASIGRPEFGPAIDLPTFRWSQEIASHMPKPDPASLAALERRVDAWSGFLMGLYEEVTRGHVDVLRQVEPTMVHTGSINIDHCAVKDNQYTPSAYQPMDLRYVTAWNDQVAGPDYIHQWLISSAMLNTRRLPVADEGQPVWVATSMGFVHGRSAWPGKMVRAIAHGLSHGASGTGFAFEGFSTVTGSMNAESTWERVRDEPSHAAELRSAREFAERFAALAAEARGDYGVGVLYSRSQMSRMNLTQGMLTPQYRGIVSLTRLGYTPVLLTEEEIAEGDFRGVKALLVLQQTVPLPAEVTERIAAFAGGGGLVVVDGSSTVRIPGARKLDYSFPPKDSGRPFNWSSPNTGRASHVILEVESHAAIAPALLAALGAVGRSALASERGADAEASVIQLDGGADAKYLVVVNDSHVKTHADWHEVRETLLPPGALPQGSVLYDLTEERLVGPAGRIECDLTRTTARIYALLPRAIAGTDLAATQSVAAGEELVVAVRFVDARGDALAAALPLELAIRRPDGKDALNVWRSTGRDGRFSFAWTVPINAPPGAWTASVRSQLTGDLAELQVRVGARAVGTPSTLLDAPAIVRGGDAIRSILGARGARFVVPIFDSPDADIVRAAAASLERILAPRGVKVTPMDRPSIVTYTLTYDPTQAEFAENAKADAGTSIGKVRVDTVNRNDWFATLSGYAFGRDVILLDLVDRAGDCPMAEQLGSIGALWPEASAGLPGPGRAIVQPVRHAFAFGRSAIVIQARDAEGFRAGARALLDPPEDVFTPGIAAARRRLVEGLGIGTSPERTRATALTSRNLARRAAPKPFAIEFPGATPRGGATPPPADRVRPLERPDCEVQRVPGALAKYYPQLRTPRGFEEAWNPGGDFLGDLRFSDGLFAAIDVAAAGRSTVSVEGTFRYSERRPCSQASWEDILELHDRYVPKRRRPMAFEVRLDGEPVGRLLPAGAAEREVQVTMPGIFSGEKPETRKEEVVTRLAGEIDLPAGRHELLLIHRNVVDGKVERIAIERR